MNHNGTIGTNVFPLTAEELRDKAVELVPDGELWWETAHPMLSGHKPRELAAASAAGREIVWNLIYLIREGVFT